MPRSSLPHLQELGGELGAHLAAAKLSVEAALRIVYMPQAVFRVRPVGRCTASMPGECGVRRRGQIQTQN
jgi:ribosome assembly protein 4